jgi:hypothetical protein
MNTAFDRLLLVDPSTGRTSNTCNQRVLHSMAHCVNKISRSVVAILFYRDVFKDAVSISRLHSVEW